MHIVKKINYVDGYKISLTFNDKKTKVVDIEPYLDKGIFLLLRNPDYFKLVTVGGNTIVWPNEADFCPDVLYKIGKEVKGTNQGGTKRKRDAPVRRKKTSSIATKAKRS